MRIALESHFRDHKLVEAEYEIYESRWKNGWRIYFIHINHREILLLNGGNKND